MPASTVAPLCSDGALQALLRQLSQNLHVSDEETERTRKYFESRQCSLQALAAMDTLQWSKAQRSAQMTPPLLAGLISEIETQICGLSPDAKGTDSSFRRNRAARVGSWVCSEICFFLALGSWSLLCLLDISEVVWPDSAADEKHISKAIGLVVLVLAMLAESMAIFCKLDRHKVSSSPTLTSITPEEHNAKWQSGKRDVSHGSRCWSVAIHSILIGGDICWLLFHLIGQREQQVCIGMATLYTLTSFAFLDFMTWRQETPKGLYRIGGTDRGNCPSSESSDPRDILVDPTALSVQPQEAVTTEPCQFFRPADKWKPLFVDPTFGDPHLVSGETASSHLSSPSKSRHASKQSIYSSSLVSIARPHEMFTEPWQVQHETDLAHEPPLVKLASFGSMSSTGRKASKESAVMRSELDGIGENTTQPVLDFESGKESAKESNPHNEGQAHVAPSEMLSESGFSDVSENDREEKHQTLGTLESLERQNSDVVSALTDVSSPTPRNANSLPVNAAWLSEESGLSDVSSIKG